MKKIIVIPFLVLILGCNNKKKPINPNISSFSSLIESYTGGTRSVTTAIKIRFSKSISKQTEALGESFTVSPSVKGSFEWEDDRTLVFQPDTNLKQNQQYNVSLDLEPFFDSIEADKKTFEFSFKTIKQNFEIATEGVRFYDKKDNTKVKITGTIQTADVVRLDNLKETLTALKGSQNLNIAVARTENPNTFTFSIENIKAQPKKSTVQLKMNGKAIGIAKKSSKNIAIPALNRFEIISAKMILGNENYISVLFSNPLKEKQKLDGYIKLSGIRPRTIIHQNELKIYFTKPATQSLSLFISRFIQNSNGKNMAQDYRETFTISLSKPQIRWAKGGDKPIMPSSNAMFLPFEAIALKAVEVTVVKIFADNVLQHLQINAMEEQRELQRVGRPITKKTIDLQALGVTDFSVWNTFSLNLADIITVDPGAIYQINIGFNQSHITYPCSQNNLNQNEQSDLWNNEAEENLAWDNYENYYNTNYDWRQRENPCSPSYYGMRRSAKKIIFASDLGIITKKNDNNGTFSTFVTNLIDTKPVNNAAVTYFDYQQQKIAAAKTDSNGKASIDLKNKKPFVVVVEKDDQVGYLKLDDYSTLSLSNFDISGTKVEKGLKGFIYGERGVWCPGDTLHLTFILQNKVKPLPVNHPVIMELYDPKGQLTYKKIKDQPTGTMYSFDFAPGKEALTGNWVAQVRIGSVQFRKKIRIETVKPNRLKINLKPLKLILDHTDRTLAADLKVNWLTGAKAGGLKVAYDMLLKPKKTTFKGFENFNFDDRSKAFYSNRKPVYSGRLDREGKTRINVNLAGTKNAPGALNVMLYGKAFEESGDFSISQSKIPFYPFKSFVGLIVPEGDKRGMLLTNKKHQLQIATLDSKGNPLSSKNIKVSLYKLQWRWWWDTSYENLSNYVGSSYRKPTYTFKTESTNGKGFCEIEVQEKDWGRYYIQVEDLSSGHTTGEIAYFDWPGWAGKGKQGVLDGASMLDFSLEKENYTVGENVVISIPSTKGNRILVSLESGNEILETFWVETKDQRTPIRFTTTDKMMPNVYVNLSMIQPHNQKNNDLPLRLYGVKNINVEDPNTKLYPTVSMPKSLTPEEEFTMKVAEKNKKGMTYTVAVVDEGLLDLTNFKTPDPWNAFFKREALSVKTWDMFDKVMGAFSTRNTYITSVGGDDDGADIKEQTEANRFKPVVKFLGPFALEPGKTNSHKIKMPQYIGSVRTMVIASDENSYGSAEATTPVKQELMVQATLPRVIGPGETMKLPVTVFALNEKIKNVTLNVNVSGNLEITGPTTRTVRFDEIGDLMAYFNIRAKKNLGIGKVSVKATSGTIRANYDIEINVIPRNPVTTLVAADEIIKGNAAWNVDYQPLGIPKTNDATIEVSSMPPLNLEKRLSYLINYPHGCIEQTTSAVFPQLYLGQLIPLDKARENEIQKNVEAAIERLARYQLSDGGFSYWIGGKFVNEWGTNYAGHFLLEAEAAGYVVPNQILKKWIKYQTKRAHNWSMTDVYQNDLIQAYRLYTLALADKQNMSAMNLLRSNTEISTVAKWRLALAYATAGYERQAISMIATIQNGSVQPNIASNYNYSATFGSEMRDQAMKLETLTALDQNTAAFESLKNIAEEMSQDKWLSTQTTAYSLLAISKFIKKNALKSNLDLEISINGGEAKIIKSENYLYQYTLENADKNTNIKVNNNSDTALFLRFIKKGTPYESNTINENKNLNFSINYVDNAGNSIDVSALPKGTNFKAVVTISNPGQKGAYTEMALTQIFPSGWEILNTRLQGIEEINTKIKYKDIRDDRVMHYFDLKPNESVSFTVSLIASYEGQYYLPNIRTEAMYDDTVYANQAGKWIQVISENN